MRDVYIYMFKFGRITVRLCAELSTAILLHVRNIVVSELNKISKNCHLTVHYTEISAFPKPTIMDIVDS